MPAARHCRRARGFRKSGVYLGRGGEVSLIRYRVVEDQEWPERPFVVQIDVGNGWGKIAICRTQDDAEKWVKSAKEEDSQPQHFVE
jgi:hypothetical protein